MLYTINVPKDGYVVQKTRAVGTEQMVANAIATRSYDVYTGGARLSLSLASGPKHLVPTGAPRVQDYNGGTVWCVEATELEWTPAALLAHAPDTEGWWMKKGSIPLQEIELV